jgi:hypothetical protein
MPISNGLSETERGTIVSTDQSTIAAADSFFSRKILGLDDQDKQMASFGYSEKKQSTKTEWALTSATHCLSISSIADCVLSWGVEDDSVKTWAEAYM